MASPPDLVTLDKFEAMMPRWDPEAGSHLCALVDMGSNGIRFSISDLSRPRARLLSCIYKERAAISLFDDLSESSSGDQTEPSTFSAETITLVSRTLARFRSIAVDSYRVRPEDMIVFATEAMRKAGNAVVMLDAITSATSGLAVQILAPEVEIMLGAVGARAGFVHVKGLVLDLGGGSVQMTYMDTLSVRSSADAGEHEDYPEAAARAGRSLPYGAARLMEYVRDDSEVKKSELSALQASMGKAFEKLRSSFPSLAETIAAARQEGSERMGLDLYLCGGGFRGYGYMLMQNDERVQPYPIPAVGAYTVSGTAFRQTREMLAFNDKLDGKIFGISKRRRKQFPAIVAVIDELIAAVPSIRSATFCAGGNREGALMMRLPRDIRESNPLALLTARLPSGGRPGHAQGEAADKQDIVRALRSALPTNLSATGRVTIFELGVESVFAEAIWADMGEDTEANAAAALRDATTRNPGYPGLTHLARAVLGLTLCARWGASLAPIDRELHRNLQALVNAGDRDASFWADYIGSVAGVLAVVVPAWPGSKTALEEAIQFQATAEQGKKKVVIRIEILLVKNLAGIDRKDLEDVFKDVGKKREDRELIVKVTSRN